MAPSIWQLLIIGVIVLVLFGGRGKLSSMMADLAKGIRGFRKGLSDGDDESNGAAPGKTPLVGKGETIDLAARKDESKV